WIGSEGSKIEEARYIPPPHNLLPELVGDMEKFCNEKLKLPPLIRCAMLHYQFEAIHPYLDGNGRIGRLLITLHLHATGVMPKPLLYLSAYFEKNRQLYYDQLFNLSVTGDWEAWLSYVFKGVNEQALDAIARIRAARNLQDQIHSELQEQHETANAMRLVDEFFSTPYMRIGTAAKHLGVTHAGARGILDRLLSLGIIEEVPNEWPKVYVARRLLSVIDERYPTASS
ncbi:MAG: Fic family protein, partial [SAR202 cluster bacterium]|nr:Fic family protein [SAR202 cluster bacterium]